MKIFINLLPPNKKDGLLHGMVMAYAQTMVFILFLTSLVISLTLFGLKTVLQGEQEYLQEQAATAISAESTDIISSIRQVNSFLLSADALQKRVIPWTEVFTRVSLLVPDNTTISRFRTDQANRIFIEGMAATRDESLAFQKSLEEQDFIAEVDSPLSNILQKTNVAFSLEMRYRSPEELAVPTRSKPNSQPAEE